MLSLEIRRLVEQREVVQEPVVKRLWAIAVVEVKRIGHAGRAGSLRRISGPQRAAPRKIGARRYPVPVAGGERNDGAVVIPPAHAGFHEDAVQLILAINAGKGRGHASCVEGRRIAESHRQGGPHRVELHVLDVAALSRDYSGCAGGRAEVRHPVAGRVLNRAWRVSGHREGVLEESLRLDWRHRRLGTNAAGSGTTKGLIDVGECRGEGLAAQCGHEWHGAQVDGLVLVAENPADVADLQHDLWRQFPLDGQSELIGPRGFEVWIELGCVARLGGDNTAEVRLGQGGLGCLKRSDEPICAYTESICRIDVTCSVANSVHSGSRASDRLQRACSQERNQDQIHSIQPAVDAAPSTADHGVATAKDLPKDPVTKRGSPGSREVRAKTAVIGIVGVLPAGISNQFIANLWKINLLEMPAG